MKLDSHYYAVLGFCRACGFKKENAHVVAYASQFVDDARINHIVIQGDPPDNIDYDDIENEPSFFNMATCHSYTRMKTFNYSAMINNTCAFHFVPGCKGNNFSKKLRCAQESPVIVKILEDALEEDDLVKLGMVLHAYADTFSHQGFSGLLSKVNDIKKCKPLSKIQWAWSDRISKGFKWFFKAKFDKKMDSVMPAYGHGQAMEYPDLPYAKWSYEYDYSDRFFTLLKSSSDIDNRQRYKNAFKNIVKYFVIYLKKHPEYQEGDVNFDSLPVLFETLLAENSDKKRIKSWKKALKAQGLFNEDDPRLTYNEDMWLDNAFANFKKKRFHQRKVTCVTLAPDFGESYWYRYYLAVKWYKEKFFQYCSQAGLVIPS